jgi:hypothetical protein
MDNNMELLKTYFTLEKQIHDYFGYEENWKVIPLCDSTDYYWMLIDRDLETETPRCVRFCSPMVNNELNARECMIENEEIGDYYEEEIYTQRFLPIWIYRKDDYTMICVDTHTDGNKFLRIFDNKKEVRL